MQGGKMQNRRDFIKMSFYFSLLAWLPQYLCANSRSIQDKSIIIYYSRTLNTHILAKFVAQILQIPILRLETLEEYPKDYDEMVALARKERMQDLKPPLKPLNIDIIAYRNIILGTPIWGMSLASPLESFLSNYNLRGKTIIPFCTNAGYGLGNSIERMRELSPQAKFMSALSFAFDLKEKDTRNLKTINEIKISQDKALNKTQREKIERWLQNI